MAADLVGGLRYLRLLALERLEMCGLQPASGIVREIRQVGAVDGGVHRVYVGVDGG